MALTSIVITFGLTTFLVALAYRSWLLSGHDEVRDDVEDRRIGSAAERAPSAVHRAETSPRTAPPGTAAGREGVAVTALLSLPVLLPLLAAAVSLFALPRTAKRLLSTGTLAAVLADALVLLVRADAEGPLVLEAGGWPAPLGIVLVADRLSALLLTVSVLVALAVLLYAIGQGTAERRVRPPPSCTPPTSCWSPASPWPT